MLTFSPINANDSEFDDQKRTVVPLSGFKQVLAGVRSLNRFASVGFWRLSRLTYQSVKEAIADFVNAKN